MGWMCSWYFWSYSYGYDEKKKMMNIDFKPNISNYNKLKSEIDLFLI